MEIEPGWCLVLGASSGFGAASARAFARAGLDVFGVHLDRRATLPQAESVRKDVEQSGRRARFFNVNAADAEQRDKVVREIGESVEEGPAVRVLLHSLAFGALKPLVAEDPKQAATLAQLTMTLQVMATTLIEWTQSLLAAGLLERRARLFAMTSEGGRRAWPAYGPVALAKAALEAAVRQLALELAPREVTVNAICAGVAQTPALEKIPGHEQLLEAARARNPSGRLTTPDDVAQALVALASRGCGWVTGNVIHVDGGEGIAS
jgi:NAD(P)-dependent dehydrogenase (short-subunit alcohol dehydrogenase family)